MEIGTLGDGSVIKIKLGFLLSVIGSLVGLVVLFVVMRQDVLNALVRIGTLEQMNSANASAIMDMRVKITNIDDNLYYFRKQYDSDNPTNKSLR